jgi:hypothetical protein
VAGTIDVLRRGAFAKPSNNATKKCVLPLSEKTYFIKKKAFERQITQFSSPGKRREKPGLSWAVIVSLYFWA